MTTNPLQAPPSRRLDEPPTVTVEFTAQGYLRLEAAVAERFFPHDVLIPLIEERSLWLLPSRGAAAGGLILKRRNPQGDRSVLIHEALGVLGLPAPGPRRGFWNETRGGLAIPLEDEAETHRREEPR